MRLTIIVAMGRNRVIGFANALPWKLPADLRRFKRLTMGHHLLMGRKTFESIGRPLPGRTSVVITRNRRYRAAEGVHAVQSFEEAAALAERAGDDEAFVIGGAEIYALALPRADRLIVTRVHADFEGDTWFPVFDESGWTLVDIEEHDPDDRNPHAYGFLRYERR